MTRTQFSACVNVNVLKGGQYTKKAWSNISSLTIMIPRALTMILGKFPVAKFYRSFRTEFCPTYV